MLSQRSGRVVDALAAEREADRAALGVHAVRAESDGDAVGRAATLGRPLFTFRKLNADRLLRRLELAVAREDGPPQLHPVHLGSRVFAFRGAHGEPSQEL